MHSQLNNNFIIINMLSQLFRKKLSKSYNFVPILLKWIMDKFLKKLHTWMCLYNMTSL